MDGETLLLKPREAAVKLQISPRKLWALTKQGTVRCVRIGRALRYRVEDLAAFVQGLESKPTG